MTHCVRKHFRSAASRPPDTSFILTKCADVILRECEAGTPKTETVWLVLWAFYFTILPKCTKTKTCYKTKENSPLPPAVATRKNPTDDRRQRSQQPSLFSLMCLIQALATTTTSTSTSTSHCCHSSRRPIEGAASPRLQSIDSSLTEWKMIQFVLCVVPPTRSPVVHGEGGGVELPLEFL